MKESGMDSVSVARDERPIYWTKVSARPWVGNLDSATHFHDARARERLQQSCGGRFPQPVELCGRCTLHATGVAIHTIVQ